MERSEINKNYQWKTEDIFSSDEAWEKQYDAINSEIDFHSFEGSLNTAQNLVSFFKKEEKIGLVLERLYLYAHMKHDEDARIAKYTAMQAKAMALFVHFSSETAFAEPELSALPTEVLEKFSKDPSLSDYDYFIRRLIKNKAHILSAKEEKLLASGGEIYGQFQNIFSMIDNADIRFGKIKGEDGKYISLTHGIYGVLLHGEDRVLRKRAFKKYYHAYIQLQNTIAAAYYGNVQKDVYLMQARGYKSCIEKALDAEDVPVAVYENLLSSVEESLPVLHRYVALRKKALGLDEQHMYDIYVPLVQGAEMKLSYEQACDLVLKGLAPLGKDYCDLLQSGLQSGWVDVYENSGKRSGAYSTGIYGLHPYVLLNYQQTTHDVFTIAHEMGHALLLLKYILSTSQDENLKKYLLNYYLDMIRTTLHRQTMFAEFEAIAHQKVEQGVPLTSENLREEYFNLNKKYYGDSIVHDAEIAYEWSRIPHFYTSFYVYKYATGIISAISIVNNILKNGETAVSAYKKFLSSGGSDSPAELLKIAGVDLTKKEAFASAMSDFQDALTQLEQLLS